MDKSNEQLNSDVIINMDDEKNKGVAKATTEALESLKNSFPYYNELLGVFNKGEAKVELRKRYMLNAIDEIWVKAVEDAIPSLDLIIRNPSMLLVEKEEVLPVELTKKINGRTIVHLSQHTDLINELKDDGTVVPSKLLNIFQDDSYLTYENKFINTLLNRLYGFVLLRYDKAVDAGEDEKRTTLTINQRFEQGELYGNISLAIEVREPPKNHEVVKNYVYSSDLWHRVEKVLKVIDSLMGSPFIQTMGRNFVHPPIMRTNKLLKNVDFKQCLNLWEFLETYDNTGYETIVQEDLETVDEKTIADIYNSIVAQYIIFRKDISNEFNEENRLDYREETINAKFKEELDEVKQEEYDITVEKDKLDLDYSATDDQIEEAIKIALAADGYYEPEKYDDGVIHFRYRYSYMARLILAQEPTQSFYTEIKNKILFYDDVKEKINWGYELFKVGRNKFIRLDMKGKTLCVSLTLDPKAYDPKIYHHKDKSEKKKDFPFFIRVTSKLALKHVLELIDIAASEFNLVPNEEFKPKRYKYKESTPEALSKRNPPLVKVIGENNEEEIYKDRYRYSFKARQLFAPDDIQVFYSDIKNELLSYDKVKDKMSWKYEAFNKGRKKFARVDIKGKTIKLSLPLNVEDYDTKIYHQVANTKKSEKDVPFLMKVRSKLGLKRALILINDAANKLGLSKLDSPKIKKYNSKQLTLDELLIKDPSLVKVMPVPVYAKEEKKAYRCSYSFKANLVLAQEPVQSFYTEIKNKILSYENIKNSFSWSNERFTLKGKKFAKFGIIDKVLYLYLPINPKEIDEKKFVYSSISEKKVDKDTPYIIKVKTKNSLASAIEILDILADRLDIDFNEKTKVKNYKFKYYRPEVLAKHNPPLVKVTSGEMPSLTPQEERILEFKYSYSFKAKLMLSNPTTQEMFNEIRDSIVKFDPIKETTSWSHFLYKVKRQKFAKLLMKGKTLCIMLPLDLSKIDVAKYRLVDISAKNKDYTALLKIRNELSLKNAKLLIQSLIDDFGLLELDEPKYKTIEFKPVTVEDLLKEDPPIVKKVDILKGL